MDKRSDGFFLTELVVELNCIGSAGYMNNDAAPFQDRDDFSRKMSPNNKEGRPLENFNPGKMVAADHSKA